MRLWTERSYPYVLGVLIALANFAGNWWSVLSARQSGKILDDVFAMSGVGLGFWSTAATLLLAVEQKPLVRKLKKGPHFRVMVGYVFAAITWLAVLLTLTLVGVFLGEEIRSASYASRFFTFIWLLALVVAVSATFRAYHILSKVLKIAASEAEPE